MTNDTRTPSVRVCEHGALERACPLCEANTTIVALRARLREMHKALREASIRNMANANKRCFRCGGRWSRGCKEMHHKGCLAAPEAGEL